jgi:hypothetical protein
MNLCKSLCYLVAENLDDCATFLFARTSKWLFATFLLKYEQIFFRHSLTHFSLDFAMKFSEINFTFGRLKFNGCRVNPQEIKLEFLWEHLEHMYMDRTGYAMTCIGGRARILQWRVPTSSTLSELQEPQKEPQITVTMFRDDFSGRRQGHRWLRPRKTWNLEAPLGPRLSLANIQRTLLSGIEEVSLDAQTYCGGFGQCLTTFQRSMFFS